MITHSYPNTWDAEMALDKDGFRRCSGGCSSTHYVRHDVAWIQHAFITFGCAGDSTVKVVFTQQPRE